MILHRHDALHMVVMLCACSGTYAPEPPSGASETQQPRSSSKSPVRYMPVAVRANIQGGELHVHASVIPLPFIRGQGRFEVLYLDADVRVFRSQGGTAVQVSDMHCQLLSRATRMLYGARAQQMDSRACQTARHKVVLPVC